MCIRDSRTINVALVGNPNCGKTSLFNIASGAHEHVGNYSGVTVDAKEGFFDALFELQRGFPAQLVFQFARIDGIPQVVPRTVGDAMLWKAKLLKTFPLMLKIEKQYYLKQEIT